MSIKFEITKQNNIHFGIAAAVAALTGYFTSASWWVILLFAAAYFGLVNVKLELPVKLSWLWAAILLVIGAILSVFSVQYVLLTDEDFVKTTDMVCVVNVVLALAIYLVILFITNNTRLTCTIASIAILAFGFIDYFVYEFRGNEFTYADLKSAGTGLSVVTKYRFVIDYKFLYVILAAVLYIMLVRRIEVQFESAVHMRIISILLTIICVLYVIMNSMSLNTETWEKKGTYRNGYLLNFVLGIRDSFVKAPDGYSKAAVDKIAGNFKETDSSYSQSDAKNPTIIVIMNESFADLSVVGDFETNTQVTPFMDSLSENTLKGYALSSVYGAKTPNSEWEFETGNSMAFLPDGSVVYQQYINDDPTSIVSNLKNIGYTTVAMHPYYATGWSRNKVYPHLGYDETYFIDDFDQTKILREYITDQELYDKIIDRYEKKSDDEKLYIMGVTMQNHGGYGERYDNFNQKVYKVGASYTDANQYLSLLNESDKALENLITYFKGVDVELEFTSVDADVVRGWVLSLMDEGRAETTVNRKLSSLRSFYHYLLRQKLVAVDPVAKVVGPKKKKPLPVFVRDEAMSQLLDGFEFPQTFEGVRDKTMLEVFYSTGMRRAELIALRDGDVDFSALVIKVTGKRNKQRLIPFGDRLQEALSVYLQERTRFYSGECEAFFIRKGGVRLSPSSVNYIVKRYLSKVVTLKKKSPHVLRHTFATSMLNHQAELEAVKELLGHESLTTTEVYTHTTFEELKQVYEQAHPRA